MRALAILLLSGCVALDQGVPTQGLHVSWDLEVDPSNATVQSGRVTEVDGFEPQTDPGPEVSGRVHGGVSPLTFDADSRLHNEAGLATGTEFTVEVVHKPADAYGVGDRGYLLYAENDSSWAPVHHVIAHTANNNGTFVQKGIYLAGTWYVSPSSVAVYTGLQVETWVVRTDTITMYRNGHEVNHMAWAGGTVRLDDLWLGSAYGSPLTAAYRGAVYLLQADNRAHTASEVLVSHTEAMDTFGISSDYSWQPGDEVSNTGWWDEHGLRGDAYGVYRWDTRLNDENLTQSGNTEKPARVRQDGLLAIDCDGNTDSLSGTSVSAFLGTSSYEYATEFVLHSANSTSGADYNLEQLFGDVSGFIWVGARTANGEEELVVGHWNGTGAASVVLPITLDVKHDLHVWFTSGVLHASLDGSEESLSTAGPSNLGYGLRLCGRNQATAIEATVTRFVTFSSALSSASRGELDAWLDRSDL